MEYTWTCEFDGSALDKLCRTDNLCWSEVIRVLTDCIQTERRLSRFEWVAQSVIYGEPVPPKEQMQGFCETVDRKGGLLDDVLQDAGRTMH